VLEQGVIAERGSHDDLLAQNGRYAAMWRRQEAEEDVVVGEVD
jgi:ABC-type multidrug transport system fused ATPase/permease subunit